MPQDSQRITWIGHIRQMLEIGVVPVMESRGWPLDDFNFVRQNYRALLSRMADGSMPPGVPPIDLAFVERWIDDECPAASFEQIVNILDASVGGRAQPVGRHGPFWRDTNRDDFISTPIYGETLVTLGDGANSGLVKALKGEAPFDGSGFPRMPFNLWWTAEERQSNIDLFKQWKSDGFLEDDTGETSEPSLAWRRTNAPVASSRTDDIWFIDENLGWAVNSNGQILKTQDGGSTWAEQLQGDMYWRCIAFANDSIGWAGSLTANNRLYTTRNGGDTWSRVINLPDIPEKICGLTVVDENTVICSGTNDPGDTAAVVITRDGGESWIVRDMSEHATLLVDNHFVDANRGWVVGGKSSLSNATRDDVLPVVLYTEDGGETWRNVIENIASSLRLGEWGWKIQFLDDLIGFVSMEAFDWAGILRTEDGGSSWKRHAINDPQGNANIEGIGFIDSNVGWVGGWGDRQFQRGATSATLDGGQTWADANEVGRFLNRFRFIGSPVRVGYASGQTVYKYSQDPVAPPLSPDERRLLMEDEPMDVTGSLELPIEIPDGTRRIRVDVWDRFGTFIWSLLDDFGPEPGERVVSWDFRVWRGRLLDPGTLIIRVTADGMAESQLVHYRGPGSGEGGGGEVVANSYADVVAILDEAVGGSGRPVGGHGAFWRNMNRGTFVDDASFYGVKLITVNDGAGSGLVKALRGETPFGSDTGNQDQGVSFRRMPAGRASVAAEKIVAIEKWIDNGAPE